MRIAAPCSENFKAMTKTTGGRFCSACEKTVVDFTNMSASEIASYLKSHESVCGRIKKFQLETPAGPVGLLLKIKQSISSKTGFTPLRIALLSIISGLLTFTSSCMGKMMPVTPNETTPPQQDTVKIKKEN